MSTFAAAKATIKRLAREAFAAHILEPRALQEWRYHRPGTSMYAAHIILRPGVVIIYGDLGEWILRHGERDSLAWLRGAVGSRGYLLSKVCQPTAHFWPDEAARVLASPPEDCDDDDRAMLAKVSEHLRLNAWGDAIDPYEWGRAWMEAGSDGDYPRCEYPSESALWLHALLKAFVAAVDVPRLNPGVIAVVTEP